MNFLHVTNTIFILISALLWCPNSLPQEQLVFEVADSDVELTATLFIGVPDRSLFSRVLVIQITNSSKEVGRTFHLSDDPRANTVFAVEGGGETISAPPINFNDQNLPPKSYDVLLDPGENLKIEISYSEILRPDIEIEKIKAINMSVVSLLKYTDSNTPEGEVSYFYFQFQTGKFDVISMQPSSDTGLKVANMKIYYEDWIANAP